jgi:hypothetical protein
MKKDTPYQSLADFNIRKNQEYLEREMLQA